MAQQYDDQDDLLPFGPSRQARDFKNYLQSVNGPSYRTIPPAPTPPKNLFPDPQQEAVMAALENLTSLVIDLASRFNNFVNLVTADMEWTGNEDDPA